MQKAAPRRRNVLHAFLEGLLVEILLLLLQEVGENLRATVENLFPLQGNPTTTTIAHPPPSLHPMPKRRG